MDQKNFSVVRQMKISAGQKTGFDQNDLAGLSLIWISQMTHSVSE